MAAAVVARKTCTCAQVLSRFSGLHIHRKTRVLTHIGVRHHARWFAPFLFELRQQIKAIQNKYGKEKKPRSHRENWDYDSEVFAFGKRLGEDFTDATLRIALTDRSYVDMEETRRKELGLTEESAQLEMADNGELAKIGHIFISDYIKAYLRVCYPKLPEEGICAVHDHLTAEEQLAYVAKHLGFADITLCSDFPVSSGILSTAMKAVIGSIVQDSGAEKAGSFVRDFLLSQLISKDINELWTLEDPMRVLVGLLEREGREAPESRLLRHVGTSTIMPMYMVGVYSDKELLGWGPGETLAIAEEEAARVALKHIFGTTENSPPLPLDSSKFGPLNALVCEDVQRGRLNSQASVSG